MVKIYSFSILIFTISIIALTLVQITYLETRVDHSDIKRLFVEKTGMSDLSLSTEAHFVRHRSLSDLFSIFSNAPTLSEYFPSTFVYNYSQIQKKNPSRIELEK
ncbi:MAG: hypothetical protein R3331_04565 [Sulfurospirillaceae bacterium]|nr:hypothetical protein [Sulfurospirillaceae bacterium]